MAAQSKPEKVRVRKPLTQERLKELLHYDPETGEWTWIQKASPSVEVGIVREIGVIQMTFLANPLRLDRDAMVKYILDIPKVGFKLNPNTSRMWDPRGVTWHGTASPSLGQWNTYSETQKTNWGVNLNAYYRGMGWHSGPSFCGTPETWSLVLCDPLADGVHCTCTNATDYGVETVLNAVDGGDDPKDGQGLASMLASANIIAALCIRFGWNPDKSINFHRQCTVDRHSCPGILVDSSWAISLVNERIAEIKGTPSA